MQNLWNVSGWKIDDLLNKSIKVIKLCFCLTQTQTDIYFYKKLNSIFIIEYRQFISIDSSMINRTKLWIILFRIKLAVKSYGLIVQYHKYTVCSWS